MTLCLCARTLDPPLICEATALEGLDELWWGCRRGPVLTRPHVITRPCPQAWGAAYSLIRPRSFQKQLRFPPESNIKVIYDSFFEHQVLHLWRRIEFLITIWVDVFINGLPDHRINIAVFKDAGALIVFRLNLAEHLMWKIWHFCICWKRPQL